MELCFDRIVDDTLEQLPAEIRTRLVNVEIVIEDRPSADLDPDGDGLLGLYTGTPLTEREANHAGELPDVIYLFREPHLGLGLSAEETEQEVRTTLIHEIAHYFGIDDDHLDDIGWG